MQSGAKFKLYPQLKFVKSAYRSVCPSCCPTNTVKSPKGKNIILHGVAPPKHTWGLPVLSLTTKGSRLP